MKLPWIGTLVITAIATFPRAGLALPSDQSWRKLTIREKIGQTMILNGSDLPAEVTKSPEALREFFRKYPVSGIFLAPWQLDNVPKDQREQTIRDNIRNFSQASPRRLLFIGDFEEGIDLSSRGTRFPAIMALAATDSPELAALQGKQMAADARELGINWVLNPDGDLNFNPLNPLVSTRALSDDPKKVVRILSPMVRAMNEGGLISTLKHFPGDGVDSRNQHLVTTVNTMGKAEWLKTYGAIYKSMIAAGAPSIMIGHIALPAFQKPTKDGIPVPGTLSHEIVTDLLKRQLGFQGVVITDALNMAGVYGHHASEVETQIAAFKAGNDVMLWPDLQYLDELEKRIQSGEIPMSRLDDAVKRVWELKEKFGLLNVNTRGREASGSAVEQSPESPAKRIAERSITLAANRIKALPFAKGATKKILFVINCTKSSEEWNKEVFETSLQEYRSRGIQVDVQIGLPKFQKEPKLLDPYDKVIVVFNDRPSLSKSAMAMDENQAMTAWFLNSVPQDKIVGVSFGDPFVHQLHFPQMPSWVNAYSESPESQKAAVRAILGEIPFHGVSPVKTR